MKNISRRGFLGTAAAAGAAIPLFTIAGTKASGRVLGANDAIRVGVAGIHGRGNAHIDQYLGLKDVQVTYLIDPDTQPVRVARQDRSRSKGGNAPKCVQDIRKALDDKNLDAISIATPNHWHSLMTIWACQAGKDVYVEKPMQPQRPRRPRAASRRPGSTTGSSSTAPRAAASASWASEIAARPVGQVRQAARLARALLQAALEHRPQADHRRRRPTSISTSGSARRPSSRTTPTWSTTTGTGSGTSATATSATRASTRWTSPAGSSRAPRCRPRSGASAAGSATSDQGQTPNTQIAVIDFGDVQLIFEVRGLVDKPRTRTSRSSSRCGNEYYTTEGRIANGQVLPQERRASRETLAKFDVKVTPGGRVGQLHPRRPQPQAGGPATPTAATATTPAPSATWPTSRTASARRSRSTARRRARRQPRSGRDLQEPAGEPQGHRREARETDVSTGPHTDGRSRERTVHRRRLRRTRTSPHPAVSRAVRRAGNRVVGVEPMSGALNIRRGRGPSSLAWPFISCCSRLQTAGMHWRPSHRCPPLHRTVDLDRGELFQIEISDGSKATVKLLDVEATRDTLLADPWVKSQAGDRRPTDHSPRRDVSPSLDHRGVQIDCPITNGVDRVGVHGPMLLPRRGGRRTAA